MRKTLIAGNWKMNLDYNEALSLITDLVRIEKQNSWSCDVAVFPPFLYVRDAIEMTKDLSSSVAVGAQNCAATANGAYTGEVSASMLNGINAQMVLVGHSERRMYYGESSEVLKKKMLQAFDNQIQPVYCCGEALEDRKAGRQNEVIKSQLEEVLFGLSTDQIKQTIVAYEPVWAIGTGETASPEQAQDMHAFIRSVMSEKFGSQIADQLRILYGGSMKPANANELLSQPDVDGGLIGGASLKSADFAQIIAAAS